MLIQTSQSRKAVLTEIASIKRSIPRSVCRKVCACGVIAIVVPADLLVGKDVISVDFSAVGIDLLPIDA